MKTKHFHIFFLFFIFCFTAYAGEYTDSLRNVIKIADNEISRMHAQTLLAVEHMPADMDTARELLEAASALATAVDHPVEMAAWLNISGNYNWFSGNTDSAMVNYRITYSMDVPEVLGRKAAATINIGILYSHAGEIDSARVYKTRAREMFIELEDSAGLAHSNRSLGVFYFRQNNYELSLRHHLEALKYHESVQDTFALIYGYDSMGNVLANIGQYEESENYFLKAIDLYQYYPITPNIGSVYNNISAMHEKWGVNYPEKSIEYAKKGLEVLEKHPSITTEVSLYGNLGMYYLDKHEYDTAREWFMKAFNTGAADQDSYLYAGLLMNYGRLLAATGDYSGARRYFEQTLDLSKVIGSFSRAEAANHKLFRLDSLMGNHLAAIAHLQESNRLRDTIWQKDRADRIAELRILHELDQKEAENKMLREANELKERIISNQRMLVLMSVSASVLFVLLIVSLYISRRRIHRKKHELELLHKDLHEKQEEIQKQNELLESKNHELEELNQTRNKFFSIISHDLKGPFNSLLGFLSILVEDSESMGEKQRQEILVSLHQTSMRTFDMLTNLLEWASIQRQKIINEPKDIHLRELVEESAGYLSFNINKKEHRLNNEIDPVFVAHVDPNLLRSVLINLINNAVKFTGRGGEIRVHASKSDTACLEICVSDNGIGIPEENISKLFKLGSEYRRPGTEKEVGTGLGLITVKELVTLMGGSIRVESEPGKGSTFCISIPASN